MIDRNSSLTASAEAAWAMLLGELVVVDLSSPFVYLGRLVDASDSFLVLDDADAHDLRDTTTTRERYVLDCRLHGIRANRHRVWIRVHEIVGLSRLQDVVIE